MSSPWTFYIRHSGQQGEGVLAIDGKAYVTPLSLYRLLSLQHQLTETIIAEVRRLGIKDEPHATKADKPT